MKPPTFFFFICVYYSSALIRTKHKPKHQQEIKERFMEGAARQRRDFRFASLIDSLGTLVHPRSTPSPLSPWESLDPFNENLLAVEDVSNLARDLGLGDAAHFVTNSNVALFGELPLASFTSASGPLDQELSPTLDTVMVMPPRPATLARHLRSSVGGFGRWIIQSCTSLVWSDRLRPYRQALGSLGRLVIQARDCILSRLFSQYMHTFMK
jgi:hypothetical protein